MDKEKFMWEEEWERTRILWATIINTTPGIKKAVSPKELIHLERDGAKVDEMSPERAKEILDRRKEIEAFAKKRFGAKLKKSGKQ